MIFTGTVLGSGAATAGGQSAGAAPGVRLSGNFLEFHFRIDRAIAGVQRGQILTIREWAGASSRQPRVRSGERVLLFLYPPGRLGLTSPVGGAQGQIRLDSTGQSAAGQAMPAESKSGGAEGQDSEAAPRDPPVYQRIPVAQLERAIRAARGEQP
jgi:hypothetical protein